VSFSDSAMRDAFPGVSADDEEPAGEAYWESVLAEAAVALLPGNTRATGNSLLPVARPPVSATGQQSRATLYADVAGMLDGTLPSPPEPDVLRRSDGVSLFYAGQVNLVFGDPESGKTWLCLAAVAETLTRGRSALVLDLDHNGAAATVSRLIDLGAPESALRDPQRFRYAEPEDGAEVLAIVADAGTWHPYVIVLDSVGEVVPLFGGSSNSPDDFTRVHAAVMKPLAMGGAAVLCVDHLAKNSESRAMGSTGTAAKKRAVGGVSLRVTIADQFAPGHGGSAHVTIAKDRHGGLRQHCGNADREPLAGTFVMRVDDTGPSWHIAAPADGQRNPAEAPEQADLDALAALDPAPASVRDVADRLHWKWKRAGDSLRAFRALPAVLPVAHTGVGQHGNTPSEPVRCRECPAECRQVIWPRCFHECWPRRVMG